MSKKILVVDDEPATRKLVSELLKKQQYEVITANDGLDALNSIKKNHPDLVVLDIMMPEMNGYDVCYELRFNKQFEQLPIILLTKRSKELDDSIGKRVNIEYMSKPINTKLLLEKIESLLK